MPVLNVTVVRCQKDSEAVVKKIEQLSYEALKSPLANLIVCQLCRVPYRV